MEVSLDLAVCIDGCWVEGPTDGTEVGEEDGDLGRRDEIVGTTNSENDGD